MVRCALGADGVVRVGRVAPGRGAWLCSPACFALAEKRKAFDRAWRRPLPVGALEVLREAFPYSNDRMKIASTTGSDAAPSTPTKG
jgi:predicted RNA-binding protein YlxR (DUF448 family)